MKKTIIFVQMVAAFLLLASCSVQKPKRVIFGFSGTWTNDELGICWKIDEESGRIKEKNAPKDEKTEFDIYKGVFIKIYFGDDYILRLDSYLISDGRMLVLLPMKDDSFKNPQLYFRGGTGNSADTMNGNWVNENNADNYFNFDNKTKTVKFKFADQEELSGTYEATDSGISMVTYTGDLFYDEYPFIQEFDIQVINDDSIHVTTKDHESFTLTRKN